MDSEVMELWPVVNLELLGPMLLKLVAPVRPRPSRQVRRTRSDSEDHASGHLDCTFPAGLSAVFVFVTLVFADMT